MARTQASLYFISYVLLLVLLNSTLSAGLCHPDDLKALLKIKEAFNNASLFDLWTPEFDCCDDDSGMLQCEPKTHRISFLSAEKDQFEDEKNQVAGSIPDAIGDLPYLNFIFLYKLPKLTGPIPHAITKLKYLTNLWITSTNVSGPIPDLGQITTLTTINLSFNNLSGPIPPSISNLRNLQTLFLNHNHLTGSIPERFGKFWKYLGFDLRLNENHLSGPIPRSLGIVQFHELELGTNKFTGDASFLFGKNKGSLQAADISRNRLSFNMTSVELPDFLQYLDVSHNMIYGRLPSSITKVPTFNASYNMLCGRIPVGVRSDQYSFIHNKCLCGSPLPPCK